MPKPKKTVVEPDVAEVRKMVLEVLEKSGKPLSASRVRKQIPKLYKPSQARMDQLLEELSREKAVFAWGSSKGKNPRPQFRREDPSAAAKNAILAALGDPKLITSIQKKAAKTFVFAPTAARDQLLKAALEKIVFAEPRLEERIQKALLEVQPRAIEGAVASVRDVRARLTPPIEKSDFDETVLKLARENVFSLHEFSGYLEIEDAQRQQLVCDGKGNYYGGITFARHEAS